MKKTWNVVLFNSNFSMHDYHTKSMRLLHCLIKIFGCLLNIDSALKNSGIFHLYLHYRHSLTIWRLCFPITLNYGKSLNPIYWPIKAHYSHIFTFLFIAATSKQSCYAMKNNLGSTLNGIGWCLWRRWRLVLCKRFFRRN